MRYRVVERQRRGVTSIGAGAHLRGIAMANHLSASPHRGCRALLLPLWPIRCNHSLPGGCTNLQRHLAACAQQHSSIWRINEHTRAGRGERAAAP